MNENNDNERTITTDSTTHVGDPSQSLPPTASQTEGRHSKNETISRNHKILSSFNFPHNIMLLDPMTIGQENLSAGSALAMGLSGVDAISFLSRQYEEEQISRLLFQQQLQQNHQIDQALQGFSSGSPFFGRNPFLNSLSSTRHTLEQATLRQQHEISIMKAQAGLIQSGLLQAGTLRHSIPNVNHLYTQDGIQGISRNSENIFSESQVNALQSASSLLNDDDAIEKDGKTNEEGKTKANSAETFPQKVYRMIEDAERDGMGDVVSFLPHGKAFSIHKPRQFISDVMPKFFSTNRMSSFQRQLNLYGFRRITDGVDKGAYFHELFSKGQKNLCKQIKRKKNVLDKDSSHLSSDHLNTDHFSSTVNDAARLYQLQMVQAMNNLHPSSLLIGHGGNQDNIASASSRMLQTGGVSSMIPYSTTGIPFGMNNAALSALLERRTTELMLAHMKRRQKDYIGDQKMP
jgi:HSF-type DNA-binding